MQTLTQVHQFVRYCNPVTFTTAGQQTGSFAVSNRLADLANVSDFVNLYDQYRIDKVEITMSCPDIAQADNDGWLWWVVDLDDANAQTQTAMLQKADAKFMMLSEMRYKTQTVSFKPAINAAVTVLPSTGIRTIGSFLNTGGWLELGGDGPLTEHHGLKFNVVNNTIGEKKLYLTCKLYVSMRGAL